MAGGEIPTNDVATGIIIQGTKDLARLLRPIVHEGMMIIWGPEYAREENNRRKATGRANFVSSNIEDWEFSDLVFAIRGSWRPQDGDPERCFPSFFFKRFGVSDTRKLYEDFVQVQDARNPAAHEDKDMRQLARDFLAASVRILESLNLTEGANKFRLKLSPQVPPRPGSRNAGAQQQPRSVAGAEERTIPNEAMNDARGARDSEARTIFDTKITNRGNLAQKAKAYFRDVDRLVDFPLIGKEEWLPKHLVPLDAVRLEWLGRKSEDVEPVRLALFDGKSCSDWSKLISPKMLLEPGYAYRLMDVEANTEQQRFSLMFQASDYLAYYNTCEALAFEVAEWCVRNRSSERAPSYRLNDLPFHGSPDRIFDLSGRNAVAGLNALLIFFGGPGGTQFFLHHRSTSKVAEAQNTYHVVPAGTFQPDSYADAHHQREFSLRRTILREFSEELLGYEQLQRLAIYGEDFLNEKKIRKFVEGERNGSVKLFFLGLGFDPLTTKPEILSCIAINADALEIRDYKALFKSNWEGTHFAVPWSRGKLVEFAEDSKTLAAGSACLHRANVLFDDLNSLFGA